MEQSPKKDAASGGERGSQSQTPWTFDAKAVFAALQFDTALFQSALPRSQWILLGALLLGIAGILYFGDDGIGGVKRKPGAHYVPVYTLVADTVSKSGVIVVNLPDKALKTASTTKITFDPEIKGEWVESEIPDALVYQPMKTMEVGTQYLASLTLPTGTITKPFSIDEDPKVVAVFPQDGVEVELQTPITIAFNRPMVPLTALSEQEEVELPVVITPKTEGKFKWITTRTLQFVPKNGLIGSANYAVSINPGFVSIDGVPVSGKEARFTTKRLSLRGQPANSLIFNRPLHVWFNQAVDIESIRSSVVVEVASTQEKIPFSAEYGTRQVWDSTSRRTLSVIDRSSVLIRPIGEQYGVLGAWKVDTSYKITASKVLSIGGGDIPLFGDVRPMTLAQFRTGNLLKYVQARSPRSTAVSTKLFDPEGTLELTLHDEIDLDASEIEMKGLAKVSYGKKCEQNSSCKTKIDDSSVIVLSVNKDAYDRGETVELNLKSLVNRDGYVVGEGHSIPIHIYDSLRVRVGTSLNALGKASVKSMTLCSNNPLYEMDRKQFQSAFTANGYMVFGRFGSSYLRQPDSWRKDACSVGEFVTDIQYGLHPDREYLITGTIKDAFGQSGSISAKFATESVDLKLRFVGLQKMYNVTTPARTRLSFMVENFDYANVHMCKVSPDSMVTLLTEGASDVSSIPPTKLPCVEQKSDTIQLKKDPWVNQYFQIELAQYFEDPRGQYVVSVSHPNYKQFVDVRYDDTKVAAPLYGRSYLSVTNLSVAAKSTRAYGYDEKEPPHEKSTLQSDVLGSLLWVTDQQTQKNVSGAAVSVFTKPTWDAALRKELTGTTNTLGLVTMPIIKGFKGVAVTAGDESAVITDWADTVSSAWSSSHLGDRMYLYTDRPIYRPGQEVAFKGIHRLELDQQFEVIPERAITVTIRNSNYDVLETQKLTVNKYGVVSGTVRLKEDAPLGSYYIGTDAGGGVSFDVAEYVGAAFEITAKTDKEEYVAGDTAKLDVNAMYYFGSPVDGGSVDYSVSAQDYYFDRFSDEQFNFGHDWYYCYDCGYGDSFVTRGTTDISGEGKANIELPLTFDKYFSDEAATKSKIFVVQGTAKDLQGRSVSFQQSFIVHRGTVYLGARTDPSVAEANQDIAVTVQSVSHHGVPMAKGGIDLVARQITWNDAKRQEVDGGYYSRPEQVFTEVSRTRIATDRAGSYVGKLSFKTPGQYEVSVETKDDVGNVVRAKTHVYIVGPGSVSVRPTNNATLDLVTSQSKVKVGDRVSFVIPSPYPKAKALVTLERGKILSYDIVDITSSMTKYTFTVTEDHIPNIFASVLLLSPEPQVKYGALEFSVNTAEKAISIEVTADKKDYLPGEEVSLSIETKDHRGRPVPASVSLAVADLSVLALKGNPKKNPLVFFYHGQALAVMTMTNVKNILTEAEIPTGTKGGGGGDGLDKKARGEFKDTAYWSAQVETDASGRAQVTFTLPDNITKWQVESLGVTEDTRLGIAYDEISAKKDVMLVPLRPRFIVPGDQFSIGAKIFNESDSSQTLTVSVISPQLALKGDKETRITVPAKKTATVYFDAEAPTMVLTGPHVFTVSASNDVYKDTVIQSIPITKNTTYESVATQHTSTARESRESLYLPSGLIRNQGGLYVRASATLAPVISDGLKYFAEYAYGCSEQLASKLSAIAIGKRLVKMTGNESLMPQKILVDGRLQTVEEAVTASLAKIYAHATPEGGFAFYQGMSANVWITERVLHALLDLREAGYVIDQQVIARASAYLANQLPTLIEKRNAIVTKVMRVLERTEQRGTYYRDGLAYMRSLMTLHSLANSLHTSVLVDIAHLAAAGAFDNAFKKTVFTALENRVAISGRGAYVANVNNVSTGYEWAHLNSAVENTAQALEAMVKNKSSYQFMDEMMRWMRSAKQKDNSWGSTQSTLAILRAVLAYSESNREFESNFTLTATLNDQTLFERTYASSTIYGGDMEKTLPIADIAEGALHTLAFAKTDHAKTPNQYYYDAALTYYLPTENIAPRDEGISVTRALYSLKDENRTTPLSSAKVGEVIRGVLTVTAPMIRQFVAVEDFIPAGFEIVDFSLDTENESVLSSIDSDNAGTHMASQDKVPSPYANFFSSLTADLLAAGEGAGTSEEALEGPITYPALHASHTELHDDRVFLFIELLYPGNYQYVYYLRATTAGTYQHLPAVVSAMYTPEVFGRTGGSTFEVKK